MQRIIKIQLKSLRNKTNLATKVKGKERERERAAKDSEASKQKRLSIICIAPTLRESQKSLIN